MESNSTSFPERYIVAIVYQQSVVTGQAPIALESKNTSQEISRYPPWEAHRKKKRRHTPRKVKNEKKPERCDFLCESKEKIVFFSIFSLSVLVTLCGSLRKKAWVRFIF